MKPYKQHLNTKHPMGWILVFVGMFFSAASVWSAEDNQILSELLTKYNQAGQVDYAGLKAEETRLDAYLEGLANVDADSLPHDERFAFYTNAYNAWTIKLILSGYPGVASIKDLGSLFKSPWKKKIVKLKGGLTTLDHIEHDILRPEFKDPRIHFAVNCASKGCPPLYREPFVGSQLDKQLDEVTRQFINNPEYNRLEGNKLYVSSIFKWFREDFNNAIIDFFEAYASDDLKREIQQRKASLKIKYLDYDWSLNGS
jgi:Protein of unknown function, DUF547